MGLYIFPLHLQYIQVSEEFTNNPNVFNEMKIFCTLLWTAIVAIAVERCRAEFLLVEIDDAAGDAKVLPPKEQNAPASIEDPGYCIGRCGGICPPCKSEPIPKEEDPGHCIGNECGGICPPCKSEPIPKEDPVDEVDGLGKDTEKLVVKSKVNQNTLVVQSDVVGGKDSPNIGKVADDKLVVKSKLNPDKLVVQSDIVSAKNSANIREVADERLVVKSKLNPDTLVVESKVVGVKDSTEIGEVADEKEIRLTPRQCCEKANVPEFCLGLCSPADVMARQGKRINACSKYDTIIEECFQAAEAKKPLPPKKP